MGKKRHLPVLTIMQTGNPGFERYVIEDEKDRQWNGEAFVDDGLIYASSNHAAIDMQEILKGHFEGVEPQRYVVPLCVEVYSDDPIHVTEVVRHLSRATRLSLNVPKHGHGPGNSLLVPWIDWTHIESVEKFPDE